MLFALDIGNDLTTLGLYDGQHLRARWQITTPEDQSADEIALKLSGLLQMKGFSAEQITDAIIGSVVPPLTERCATTLEDHFGVKPKVVGPGLKTGMAIKYEDPRAVGADRIANAIAARAQHPEGGLLLVALGTATTLDVVSPKGAYLGGAICPGLALTAEALFSRGARLPRVEIKPPAQVVGRNTITSLQSGLLYGHVSMVDGLGDRMLEALDFECTVIATGPLASTLAPMSKLIQHVAPQLTLDGLMLLYHRNRRSGR
ncbi:MAG: type III pantothenate kinase [Bradymonadia bacterium]